MCGPFASSPRGQSLRRGNAILILCLALLLPLAAHAQTAIKQATATPGTPRAVTTFESIGISWTPGTNPGTAGCQLQYRKAGSSTWKNGLAMWYDTRNSECRGSIVQVAPGSTYNIQVSVQGGSVSRQLSAQTWAETFPVASTVTLPPGVSTQTLNITQGGTASGYVLYTTDPGTPSVIDGGNQQLYNVVITAPYVILRGVTLTGAQADAIRIADTAHDVVIENNDISNWGRSRNAVSTVGGYALGVDGDAAIHAVCSNRNMVRTIVQRNRIHDPRYGANSWSEGHPAGPQGLNYQSCGGNHVIRYNEITSIPGHYFTDGIGGGDNLSTVGFPNADSDIYGNIVMNTWDDGIEAEGGDKNVRVWGNYLNQTTTGIASTIAATGPIYIFRNVYNRSRELEGNPLDSDDRDVFAKSGSTSLGGGRRYLFHNTLLQATDPSAQYPLGAGGGVGDAGRTITNTVTRNNIFHIWKDWWDVFQRVGSGNDFGYDLYNGNLGLGGATETNGIKGVPIYQTGNGWTSESGGMYQLAPNSPGYDRGALIPNFNDNYTGSAPDVGAHEAGTPAMVFGVRGGTGQ